MAAAPLGLSGAFLGFVVTAVGWFISARLTERAQTRLFQHNIINTARLDLTRYARVHVVFSGAFRYQESPSLRARCDDAAGGTRTPRSFDHPSRQQFQTVAAAARGCALPIGTPPFGFDGMCVVAVVC